MSSIKPPMTAEDIIKHMMVMVSQQRDKGPLEHAMSIFQFEDGGMRMSFMFGPKRNDAEKIAAVTASALAQMDQRVIAVALVVHGPGQWASGDTEENPGYLYKLYSETDDGTTCGLLAFEDGDNFQVLADATTANPDGIYDGEDIFPYKILEKVQELKAEGSSRVDGVNAVAVEGGGTYNMDEGTIEGEMEGMTASLAEVGSENEARRLIEKLKVSAASDIASLPKAERVDKELAKLLGRIESLVEGMSPDTAELIRQGIRPIGKMHKTKQANDNVPLTWTELRRLIDSSLLMALSLILTYAKGKEPPLVGEAMKVLAGATGQLTGLLQERMKDNPMVYNTDEDKTAAAPTVGTEDDSNDWQ